MPAPSSSFYLGCAVWAYPGWVGSVYPPKSPPAQFLQLYSQRFTAVEGNSTFYTLPRAELLKRWVSQTPPGFQFCPKFPQAVTHRGLLQPQLAAAQHFQAHLVAHLGDRLGPLLLQLPPSYGPACWEDLQASLPALASGPACAVEVRHPAWFAPPWAHRLQDLLTALGLGRVLLDSRPIYQGPGEPHRRQERRKPNLPLQPELTAAFTLIRFISHPERHCNQSYLREWSDRLADWLHQGRRVYYFVHCPVEDHSPWVARDLYRALVAQGAAVPLLPWEAIAPPPQQLQLF